MRPRRILAALLAFLCASAPGQQADAPESAASPAELVALLGSPSWKEREAAQQELVKRGEEARAIVSAALGSSDPEVSLRAAQILDRQGHAQEDRATQAFKLDPDSQSFEAMLLVVAKAVDPGANTEKAEAQLSAWGDTLRARIGGEVNPQLRLRRVVDFHFVVQGLLALPEREPDALTLVHAVEHAQGTEKQIDPLALALLIKVVAHRAGVELSVAQSAHRVLLVDTNDPAQPRWVDLLQDGKTMDREEAMQLLLNLPRVQFEKAQLEPESERATLDRYLGEVGARCRIFGAADIALRVAAIRAELGATEAPEDE